MTNSVLGLSDTIAQQLANYGVYPEDLPAPVDRDDELQADGILAALRESLREHPALIAQLGWQVRATVGAWGNKQEVLFAPPVPEDAL